MQEVLGAVKMVAASSPISMDTAWKPGGVLLAAVVPCSHRVSQQSIDQMGRWCSLTLSGKDQTMVRFYNIYQCVEANITNVGPSTYFAQQWSMLRQKGILNNR